MTRERKAQIATVVILLAGLALVAMKRGGWQASAASLSNLAVSRAPAGANPQDTVYRMMDAARDGDVRAYLGCYTGQMESGLRQLAAEKGEPALAAYIRNFNASVKGVAIQEPQSTGDREVRLRVEFVYRDRNEAQIYYLEQTGGNWKISKQENAEGVKTLVPYGTTVE
jgi:hypothetical protein